MVRGGVLLAKEDSTLAIEVVKGDKKTPTFMKLAELTKGRRNPEGIYEIVGPLRVGYELQGKEILIPSDLAFLRYMERQLDYEKIGSLTQATAVEFSVRSNGKVECHDIN